MLNKGQTVEQLLATVDREEFLGWFTGLSPEEFFATILNVTTWPSMVEIANSVRDYPVTAVTAPHGVSKTFTASCLVLWFLCTKPKSRVITTAPTYNQVVEILWREIRKQWRLAPSLKLLFPAARCLTDKLEIDEDWVAFGRTTDETTPENLQGIHAESGDVLAVIDEASGVKDAIFDVLSGATSSASSRQLWITNPLSTTGRLYNVVSRENVEGVNYIAIKAYDTPNFKANGIYNLQQLLKLTPEEVKKAKTPRPELMSVQWARQMYSQLGSNPHHPEFLSRVIGDFAIETEDLLLTPDIVNAATTPEREAMIKAQITGKPAGIGVDVGRGGDLTVLIEEQEGYVFSIEEMYSKNTQDVVQKVRLMYTASEHTKPYYIGVDTDGIGAGVYDPLVRLDEELPVYAIYNNSNAKPQSDSPLRFFNLATQLYWNLRVLFHTGKIYIPYHEKLIYQLTTRRFEYKDKPVIVKLPNGKTRTQKISHILLEPKDKWKTRMQTTESPDYADALAYCFGSRFLVDNAILYETPKTGDISLATK